MRGDDPAVVRREYADETGVYVASSVAHAHLAHRVPEPAGPFEATRLAAVFVAEA